MRFSKIYTTLIYKWPREDRTMASNEEEDDNSKEEWLTAYKNLSDDLRAYKQQRWSYVYYCFLIYAGIIGYQRINTNFGFALVTICLITAGFTTWLIFRQERRITINRILIKVIQDKHIRIFKHTEHDKDENARQGQFWKYFDALIGKTKGKQERTKNVRYGYAPWNIIAFNGGIFSGQYFVLIYLFNDLLICYQRINSIIIWLGTLAFITLEILLFYIVYSRKIAKDMNRGYTNAIGITT